MCKDCEKKYKDKWYQNHKQEVKNRSKQYRINYKYEVREYQRLYRINNSEFLKERDKIYYEENKDKILEYEKQYYKKHDLEKKEYAKEYRKENKNKINKYVKERMKRDPTFKLRQGLSRDIGRTIKLNGSSKQGKSILKYLSYSISDLKEHLEEKFLEPGNEWMTWNNHRKYKAETWDNNDTITWTWQIDRITPQSLLPYTSMEDENFQKCWALSNLRFKSRKPRL